MKDTYLTLSKPCKGIYKEKGSKFLAFAFPVQEENDIKRRQEEVRKAEHAARHHCFAWKLGLDDNNYRENDDGEPNNSAGKPILGQIVKYELTDILIIVVRYFGGTKLGVGGLINAYRTAAANALENGKIVKRQLQSHYQLNFEYDQMNSVMAMLKELDLHQYDQEFELDCALKVSFPLSDTEPLLEKLDELEDVRVTFLKTQ